MSWEEHEAAWVKHARLYGAEQTPEAVAERGGFTIGELTEYLGRTPKSWRATPAERVNLDYVQVFADDAGEWRWHRKAANNEIISESGEGYVDPHYAIKMATRLNAGVEIRLPQELAASTGPAVDRPTPPEPVGPATPADPLGPEDDAAPDAPVPAPEPEEPPAAPHEPPRPFDGPVIPFAAGAPEEPDIDAEGDEAVSPEAQAEPAASSDEPPATPGEPADSEANGAAGASPLDPPTGG